MLQGFDEESDDQFNEHVKAGHMQSTKFSGPVQNRPTMQQVSGSLGLLLEAAFRFHRLCSQSRQFLTFEGMSKIRRPIFRDLESHQNPGRLLKRGPWKLGHAWAQALSLPALAAACGAPRDADLLS